MKGGRRAGFAMVIAIALIGLTAVTIGILGDAVYHESARTRMAGEDAQLRELLLAGVEIVQASPDGVVGKMEFPLPGELVEVGAKLTVQVQRASADQKEVYIQAELDRRQCGQTLRLSRESGKWRMESAKLSDD